MWRAEAKIATVAIVIGFTTTASACEMVQFASEALLRNDQNTEWTNFQEIAAFAAGQVPAEPVFTGHDPRFETGLDAPIDLTGYGFAVAHYDVGTTTDPMARGGIMAFYYITGSKSGDCDFVFPQLGNETANDPITSVALFKSKPVPDSGASWVLLGIAVGGLIILNRRLKAARHG